MTRLYFALESAYPVERVVGVATYDERRRRVEAELFLIADSKESWSDNYRIRFPDVEESLSEALGSGFVEKQLKEIAAEQVRQRVRELWDKHNFRRALPDVVVKDVEPIELFAMRLRGHGEGGIKKIREESGNADLREQAHALLQQDPIRIERRE